MRAARRWRRHDMAEGADRSKGGEDFGLGFIQSLQVEQIARS